MIASRRMRWAGYVARIEENGAAYGMLMGSFKGKRPLRRPRRSWVNNIERNLREIGCSNVDWIDLAQDRGQQRVVVNPVRCC
jgi:hypothetical protein